MFWFVILLIIVAICGASWLAGTMINKRSAARGGGRGGHRMTRAEQLNAARLSGAFPVRKEDQP